MLNNMVENPMILDYQRRPRYREVIDELNNERYIVDEQGWEVDPALLCSDEQEDD